MKKSFCLVALTLVLSAQVFAQDQQVAAEVCAAAEEHYIAIRARDMDTVIQHHLPEFTFFTSEGGLLWTFDSLDQQRSAFGLDPTFNNQSLIRHCSAQVYGDTGIATYYLTGSVTTAGATRTGTWRVTEVWVKQQGEWKEAHHHESPLLESVQP
jgi:ketosteroid isomerase-like protein